MLNPDVDGVLGIRIPQLRLLAKSIAADSSWQEYVASADTEFMESRMLHGMVIGYVKVIQYCRTSDSQHYQSGCNIAPPHQPCHQHQRGL